jgi:type I restriction enzyme, S subunit
MEWLRRVYAEYKDDSSEGPWQVPKGWVWTPIGAVARLRGEKCDPRVDGALPFVGMDDIETDGLKVLRSRPFVEMKSLANRYRAGDLLYGRLRPYLNKTAFVSEDGACSGELLVLTPRPGLDGRYLQYFMHSRRFVGWVSAVTSGDRPRISFDTAASFSIPLAPLAEQRRIVAKVDALFAEIDEGEAALEATRKGIDTFRRALLKAAVNGELTKDWRTANAASETGHDLLARIKVERAARTPAKGRGRRIADAPPLENLDVLQLPDGWARATLGELFDISTGSTPSRADPTLWNGGIPWVSSGEVAFCRIRSTRETISTAGLGNATTRLHPVGTVLLAMIGEGKTRGQCAILDVPAANNQNAAAIRVSATPIPPEFVYELLEQRYVASRQESQGGNQPALNAAKVAEMAIRLPPLNEIHEILHRISQARTASTDVSAILDAQALDAVRLRQAVLKAAFEGRLVSQNAADEPASALLARVKIDQHGATSRRRFRWGATKSKEVP